MKRKPNLEKALKAAKVHFEIPNKQKVVMLPDQFEISQYPARTQKALNDLHKLGFQLQLTIQ